jgi:hypothetical protein
MERDAILTLLKEHTEPLKDRLTKIEDFLFPPDGGLAEKIREIDEKFESLQRILRNETAQLDRKIDQKTIQLDTKIDNALTILAELKELVRKAVGRPMTRSR